MKDRPYRLHIPVNEIPDHELPQLYRSLRTSYVLHIKQSHVRAVQSLTPILALLRDELKARNIKRTA